MINLVIKGQMLLKNNSKARYFVRDHEVCFFFLKIAGSQVQAPRETANESTEYPSFPGSASNHSVPSSDLSWIHS